MSRNPIFLLIAALLFAIPFSFFCQRGGGHKRYGWVEYGLMSGASNYLGEIGGKSKTRRNFVVDMKLAKTRWAESAFFKWNFYQNFTGRISFDYLRIEGDDKLTSNIGRRFRNANFRNDLFDLELACEWAYLRKEDIAYFRKITLD